VTPTRDEATICGLRRAPQLGSTDGRAGGDLSAAGLAPLELVTRMRPQGRLGGPADSSHVTGNGGRAPRSGPARRGPRAAVTTVHRADSGGAVRHGGPGGFQPNEPRAEICMPARESGGRGAVGERAVQRRRGVTLGTVVEVLPYNVLSAKSTARISSR